MNVHVDLFSTIKAYMSVRVQKWQNYHKIGPNIPSLKGIGYQIGGGRIMSCLEHRKIAFQSMCKIRLYNINYS